MIGNQYVVRRSPPGPLELSPWTFEQVRQVLDEGEARDAEAVHLVEAWMDMAHVRPLKKIASFLGDEEDLTAGTIGEPRSIPEWVHPVKEYLNDVFIYKITRTYFDGYPWSRLEYGKQSFCKYLCHFINTPG